MKKVLKNLDVYIGTVFSIVMVCVLFANVVGRKVFHNSVVWAEEVCLMLYILMIYFGAAGAVKTRQHLRLEILVARLKPKNRMYLEIFNNIVFMIFNVVILFGIIPIVLQLFENKTAAAVTGIPKFAVYMWLPILFVVMIIRLVFDCFQRVKDYKNDPDDSKKRATELKAMQSMMQKGEETTGGE